MQGDSEVDKWRSQLRKGSLELAVLAVLSRRPSYGLEIVDTLNKMKMGISEGSIYPLLSRLRKEKKVRTEWVDAEVGHAHKVYELTERGMKALSEMLAAWREFSSAMTELIDTPMRKEKKPDARRAS